jgi:hypothetical protein
MRVAVDDGVAAWKRRRQSVAPADRRPRHVNHPDPNVVDLDDPALGQDVPKRPLVHVPDYSLDRSELPKLLVDRKRDEVAGVQDQVCLLEPPQALRRQPTRTAREVGIGDDRDERQPAAPSKNAPSR